MIDRRSRAALLTGRYPTRVGVPWVFFPQDADGLSLDETTLADLLKARNYRTICIGKWHPGRPTEYLPTRRGFDEYFGIPYSNDMTPRVPMHNTEVIEESADLDTPTSRYTEQAVRFFHDKRDAPFFLYMPHTVRHIPLGGLRSSAVNRPREYTAMSWKRSTGVRARSARRSKRPVSSRIRSWCLPVTTGPGTRAVRAASRAQEYNV